ncbi:Uncharacterized protein BM_BM1514 [Brugia malayi]|uniref:Bm1514 n=1 Tax=Brugia malayi TaxID=6279 RepID=A0A0J9Y3E9_BRUMA|nr:Uncharacterized protein BM_BM1514 [Brugia malayi]CDQ00978.1 Bm1514 [Brugia malayi]VIO86700.1 Uncharacterized protein BM_BM1514 [Brugia malayi]
MRKILSCRCFRRLSKNCTESDAFLIFELFVKRSLFD